MTRHLTFIVQFRALADPDDAAACEKEITETEEILRTAGAVNIDLEDEG
jgi:hypothetical protein